MAIIVSTQPFEVSSPVNTKGWSLGAFLKLARQRRQLATLGPEQLHDIGVSPAAAMDESRRPIWDVPANWRA